MGSSPIVSTASDQAGPTSGPDESALNREHLDAPDLLGLLGGFDTSPTAALIEPARPSVSQGYTKCHLLDSLCDEIGEETGHEEVSDSCAPCRRVDVQLGDIG